MFLTELWSVQEWWWRQIIVLQYPLPVLVKNVFTIIYIGTNYLRGHRTFVPVYYVLPHRHVYHCINDYIDSRLLPQTLYRISTLVRHLLKRKCLHFCVENTIIRYWWLKKISIFRRVVNAFLLLSNTLLSHKNV